MDKTEYRAVIKFLVLEGQSSKQVEERLTSVYGQSSPSSSTIKRWVKEFQRGRESLEDDPRSGRPTTSTSPENIEKVHKLVIENRRISLYELEEATAFHMDPYTTYFMTNSTCPRYVQDGSRNCFRMI